MRIPIAIPPGLRRDGTEGQSRGRWLYGSLVRNYGDDVGPVGGFRARSTHAVTGKARAIYLWKSSQEDRRIAIGTHTGLFMQSAAGTVTDITPSAFVAGEADASVNTGFGGGFFGTGAYGTARPDTGTPIPASVWMLDNWGDYLVGCFQPDGRLVEWQLDTALDAVAITNAPTSCSGLITTQDRFLLALGASGNARLVAWCDQEDNTTWTPSATNQAGDQLLDTQGAIVTAIELRGQTVILTDVDAHVAEYIGPPFVFGIRRIGGGCGAISVGCVVDQGDWAIWWGRSGFWRFDGGLTPLDCPLKDLDDGLNQTQRSKITGWHNARHHEIWWHYPSSASTENDRYVSFNYRTGEWWEGAIGDLSRLSGSGSELFTYPLLMGDDGLVYEHEVGSDWGDAVPFALSGPMLLGDGATVMRVTGIVPDVTGSPTIGFATRDYPTSPAVTVAQATLATGRTDLRFTARQVETRVEFADAADRFGKSFLEATPGGRR